MVTTSAIITFKSSSYFWKIIKKTVDWNEGINKGKIMTAGSERAILLFQRKINLNSKTKPNINSISTITSSNNLHKAISSSQYLKAGAFITYINNIHIINIYI
jgi:hypothetical protein